MAVVELLLPALPSHVRTARLVVVAAGRRAGLVDGLVDELRLAVGEACARAVQLHAQHAPDQRVRVLVTDDVLGLTVAVTDVGPTAGPTQDAEQLFEGDAGAALEAADPDATDPDMALALLTGLVDEVEVGPGGTGPGVTGTTVTMRWPLPARIPGGPSPSQEAPS